MDFDKNKVYTALNADEVKVGSEVIVADSLQDLKDRLNPFYKDYITILGRILPESSMLRFETARGNKHPFAYLISPPKKPKYKPFSDSETAFKIINSHGGWVKDCDTYYLVTGTNLIKGAVEIRIRDYWILAQYFLENFVFADDGTPVGEKIEDAAQNGGIV